ncbi:hypothetical protein GYA13_00570 [Candidatus Kuenenbacteria bacterium]|nr:hypothetical protein [Candidatus Kuenenbacteria bacterium]
MSDKQCKFIKLNGKQCEAWPMDKSDYCFAHNPDIKEERQLALSKGGSQKLKRLAEPLPKIEVRDIASVKNLLEDSINRVRTGEIDVRIANTLGFLANHFLSALRLEKDWELESRLEKIERLVLEKKTFRN